MCTCVHVSVGWGREGGKEGGRGAYPHVRDEGVLFDVARSLLFITLLPTENREKSTPGHILGVATRENDASIADASQLSSHAVRLRIT